jgi:hypothetical protein
MPFIGNQPTQGRFIELDSLTASATANYTLQLNSANFSPESVNNLLVSINGVIQGSSTMSLNGAVLTVGATLSSSDTIDFVRVFGNVGTVSTPTDGSVTANKIGSGAVTTDKLADNSVTSAKITGVSFGKILQVQYVNYTTTVNYSTTYVDIMTKNITPSATNSVILIQATVATHHIAGTDQHSAKLVKDGSALNYEVGDFYHPSGGGVVGNIKIQYVDSPNTTNAVTYKIQVKAEIGNGSTNKDFNGTNNGVSSLVLMEIGA